MIYFDNAATTSLDKAVLDAMMPYLTQHYGNASSVHGLGRETRTAVEKARKQIAQLMGAKPGEIFFTSCGTESTNTVLFGAVRDLGCRHIITSPIEHHATLHTAEFLAAQGACMLHTVALTQDGHIDYVDLERLLADCEGEKIVSLMHANNELGNISDMEAVGELCRKFKAYFHTDAVQTLGHYPLDVNTFQPDFLSASAHKFHGPKGSGILYMRSGLLLKPLIHGGSQERMMRSGTENIANAVGFAKALELALLHLHEEAVFIQSLKTYMMDGLRRIFPHVEFHGDVSEKSLYTVLNVSFPKTERTEMLSMNLDIAGICVSGGSACSSGANAGSHVIRATYPHRNAVPVRFSFSKHNTFEEIDIVLQKLTEFVG
jgi:cysteine desulfurase